MEYTLRVFRKGDEDALVEYLNNTQIYEMTQRIPRPYTMRHATEWVGDLSKTFGVVRAIDIKGKASGVISLHDVVLGHKAELGYWLAEPFWGKGLMTGIVKVFLEESVPQHAIKRVYATVRPENIASKRVLDKNGFMCEGVLKHDVFKDGQYQDSAVYAKLF